MMLNRIDDNLRPWAYSIVLHVIVLGTLILSFDWTPIPTLPQAKSRPVEAVVVDESKVKAEVEKLKKLEAQKKNKEQARQKELERKAAELKKKRQQEEKRLAALKKKRADAEKKQKAEKQRLDKLREEKAAEEKRLAALEKKRKDEETRKKKLEAAEKKRREEELRKQLAAEEQAEREAAMQKEIDKYIYYIQQKVQQNWLKPIIDTRGLSCKVRVNLIPSGEVVGVNIIKGSGNALFDRSVETAVRKASPLPLPKNPAQVSRMREIDFVFKPEA